MISLNIEKTFGFISKESVSAYEAQVKAAQEALENGTGKGNDFLGWLHLPSSISKEHLADLKATAQVLRDNCEVVIVAGLCSCTGFRDIDYTEFFIFQKLSQFVQIIFTNIVAGINHDRCCFLFL